MRQWTFLAQDRIERVNAFTNGPNSYRVEVNGQEVYEGIRSPAALAMASRLVGSIGLSAGNAVYSEPLCVEHRNRQKSLFWVKAFGLGSQHAVDRAIRRTLDEKRAYTVSNDVHFGTDFGTAKPKTMKRFYVGKTGTQYSPWAHADQEAAIEHARKLALETGEEQIVVEVTHVVTRDPLTTSTRRVVVRPRVPRNARPKRRR